MIKIILIILLLSNPLFCGEVSEDNPLVVGNEDRIKWNKETETEHALNLKAMKKDKWFAIVKAGFGQTDNGFNGDENIINKTYQIGLRTGYMFNISGTLLKLGMFLDFYLSRRAHANNNYDVIVEKFTFFDFLELSFGASLFVKGFFFGIGMNYSFLTRFIELPSHMREIEPNFVVVLGYMHNFGLLSVFAGVDVKVALYTVGLKSARKYPTFEYTTNVRRPVGFSFNLGVGISI